MSDTAQITRIIHTILCAYPSPEEIDYAHQLYGTTLYAVAVNGNVHAVTALTERKAFKTIATSPGIFNFHHKISSGPWPNQRLR